MPRPHGDSLIDRALSGKERENVLESFNEIPNLTVNDAVAKDIENIATGLFSPLQGFLSRDDYVKVITEKRLASGEAWTIPIVLDIEKGNIGGAKDGDDIGISDSENRPIAIMHLDEVYSFDKEEHSEKVYGTLDQTHPGVARTSQMKDHLIGGKISLLNGFSGRFASHFISPKQTRSIFRERGWKSVVGFQTRNVPHSGHEGLQKAALNLFDGLFINPVIGKKKPGDFKDELILETYDALLSNYYPKERVVFGILPTEMRYAGPREAIHHAIMRKNFGCTHFIVGRDHAGVGKFYPPFAAQEIFKEFPDLGIEALLFPAFFYCKRCISLANEKTCPHRSSDHLPFSGTLMRRLIDDGESPPKELLRPEVAAVIRQSKDPFV